jgi:hypothetical protein
MQSSQYIIETRAHRRTSIAFINEEIKVLRGLQPLQAPTQQHLPAERIALLHLSQTITQ